MIPKRKAESLAQLTEMLDESMQKPVFIFKHSNRCSVSLFAERKLEQEYQGEDIAFWQLDVLGYREVSNAIAKQFGVQHESPQLLLLQRGKLTAAASHGEIDYRQMIEQLETETI